MKLFGFLLFLFLLFLGYNYSEYNTHINTSTKETLLVTAKPGDSLQSFLSRELGYDKNFLKIYFKLNPEKSTQLQVGDYRFLEGENLEKILTVVSQGAITIDKKLIFLEGWNIFDIDEYLTNQELISSGEFLSEAGEVGKYKKNFSFLENAQSLEGFLYPDTYFINPNNFSLHILIEKMLENFHSKVYTPLLSPLNNHQILEIINLASIVEREERNREQKAEVAGILKKRLLNNWMIGADITACYAYNLTSQECKMNLSKYIYEKNDYNTRMKTGLPKTPINNPSIPSIQAVLNANINTPYWYYLHGKDGQIHYGITNADHEANKKYLK